LLEDDCEIDEVLHQSHVSDVRHADLIEAGRDDLACQIRDNGQSVPAVGRGRDKGLATQAEEIVLAHQPQHPFGIDRQAVASQLLGAASDSRTRPRADKKHGAVRYAIAPYALHTGV
jgi:hypothetical protein